MTGALVSDRGKTELSTGEAEKIKREVGIPFEDDSKIIDDKVSTTQIRSMLQASLEQLVSEIERCFDYYREESGGGKIDSLILFGGGAALGGLTRFLSEALGIEVKLGDSLEGLKIEPNAIEQRDKISYRLESAIGAVLSEEKEVNLLPPEIKEETKRLFKRASIQAIVTAAVLIAILVHIGVRIQLSNFKKKIPVAQLELSSLQPQLRRAEAQRLASMAIAGEPHWADVFKELSNIVQPDIYLTELSMASRTIKMKGIVDSEEAEALLSDFMLSLEKGIFKNVKLVTTKELMDEAGNEFELKCWVD
jgi:Tfp pilus assembly protein PilN